jgi:4'-phosphopantetheinyl transferase
MMWRGTRAILVDEVKEGSAIGLGQLETQAHIWLSMVEVSSNFSCAERLIALLDRDERERHGRFLFDKDRMHYLAAHALLRKALSFYSGNDPAEWRFSTNEHGRPEIDSPNRLPGVRFNLTHTPGLCACIITLNQACGIDAEAISPRHGLKGIAARMFAPSELQEIGDDSDARFEERFFQHWTLREAYIKALGLGLPGSSRDFHFDASDPAQPRLKCGRERDEPGHWQLALYKPSNSHVMAAAIHRPNMADLDIVIRNLDLCT